MFSIFGFGFFKPLSQTDFVIKTVNGAVVALGMGKRFVVTPRAMFAKVPTTEQAVSFDFSELTQDTQLLAVQGQISIVLDSTKVTKQHDFTIDVAKNGAYIDSRVLSDLHDNVRKVVQQIVRLEVQSDTLKNRIQNITVLTQAIVMAVMAKIVEFDKLGVKVERMFVSSITPGDPEVEEALGAKEREEFLGEADSAEAERRMNNAKDERRLRQYEAETNKKLEEDRAELIRFQNENLIKEAEAKAKSAKVQLDVYSSLPAGTIFALAMNNFAEKGNVGTLNITPDMLEAIRSASDPKTAAPRNSKRQLRG